MENNNSNKSNNAGNQSGNKIKLIVSSDDDIITNEIVSIVGNDSINMPFFGGIILSAIPSPLLSPYEACNATNVCEIIVLALPKNDCKVFFQLCKEKFKIDSKSLVICVAHYDKPVEEWIPENERIETNTDFKLDFGKIFGASISVPPLILLPRNINHSMRREAIKAFFYFVGFYYKSWVTNF